LLAQLAPLGRAVRLPVGQQPGEGRAAVALFIAQLAGFPAGEQISGPAPGAGQIARFAGPVEAGKQRQVDGKKLCSIWRSCQRSKAAVSATQPASTAHSSPWDQL
jgi:hypothetical protein